jgi:hypothetical protein
MMQLPHLFLANSTQIPLIDRRQAVQASVCSLRALQIQVPRPYYMYSPVHMYFFRVAYTRKSTHSLQCASHRIANTSSAGVPSPPCPSLRDAVVIMLLLHPAFALSVFSFSMRWLHCQTDASIQSQVHGTSQHQRCSCSPTPNQIPRQKPCDGPKSCGSSVAARLM